MHSRPFIWILLCLLCLAGAWFFWQRENGRDGSPSRPHEAVAPAVRPHPPSTASNILATASTNGATSAKTNQFAYRLSNTTKTIGQLVGDRHAILLENALIDTGAKLNLSIPKNLQSPGDPGAYIVQARGPIDNAFRAMLAAAGAEIVSYIPNNAYLVRAPAGVANGLAGNPLTQGVIPYEPYYKISSSMPVTVKQKLSSSAPKENHRAAGPSLLALAVKQAPLPAGTYLTLGLFSDGAAATVTQIEKLGGQIVARDNSPFGPVVRVQPPQNWTTLAALSGVQIVEPYHPRVHANDLSRTTVGVAADSQVSSNYLGLTGKNVMVEVNDSGIDATHPDLAGRVFGSPTIDTSGHGTHVAGIIAGDGTESLTVTNAQGSIMPATNGQFRGMAPLANLLSIDWNASDQELQAAAALTNALISNNSWNHGAAAYDLEAASYDAATRDALPKVTGSQPVLFVFSAGNAGNGDDTTDPGSGTPDSIESPATAKNVITVGAIQEFRNITNEVTNADGTISTPWQADTSTSYRIAGFSSRGNVGIGTEGTFGRYKPDVVAPGTSIISTRSSQWDIGTYFYQNPTNFNVRDLSVVVQADSLGAGHFPRVPINTVQVTIQLFPNARSPVPFPNLPIYFGLVGSPTYPYSAINQVSIPPDGGLTIPAILSSEAFYGFNFAVSNITSEPINFDIVLDTITTNNPGNYFLVYSNLNQSLGGINPASTGPGPYYRYETGTSMAAADVSGVLALMQDYFTNTLRTTPSPALLKAMLINGARPTGAYDLQVQNNINFEGWGLINLPDSLPPGVTNRADANCSSFFIDQNPTTALATGDSHTFLVTINTDAAALPLRVTLAWTDPPGDPAAAIKLVNNLDLIVTNFDDPANPIIFYGNDIASGSIYNTPEGTNAPNLDSINNVENVFISPLLGANYSITVIGRGVNVNAVTAQTNNAAGVYAPNVVQDYALVISCGNGAVTNAFTVTDNPIISNPTTDQDVTFVTTTNAPLLNQFVGASTPLLGTNQIPLGTNLVWSGTNSLITLGMTNQWHFYVVTNTTGFTNAAFITFIPLTLSVPRMGVFADSVGNATRPGADIDLYVTTDPTLMNLNPVAISNCVNGAQVGASSGNIFNGASLGRGGTEFVVDTNSSPSIPGEVYYVGVYSEDQEASEYGFIPIFSERPFSQMNPNGSQSVFGVPLPVDIPDGSPAHPGSGYVFGLALYPMQVQQVGVTSLIAHQNFGDLIGTLTHGGNNGLSGSIVLNNHDSLYNSSGIYTQIYDDSGQGDIAGSRPSDGPGSLNTFTGQQGNGVWLLTETDDSLTQTGSAIGFNMLIEPHHPLDKGITTTLGPLGWFYDYIDVPPGATNLTIYATNLTGTGQVDLFVKVGARPTLTDTNEFGPARLTNSGPLGPGNSISIGPPLVPGRYWVGLYNESLMPQTVYVIAKLGMGAVPGQVIFSSSGPVPILDDAVMTNSIYVSAAQTISSVDVGLRVDHPRVSDLVFHLISPDGTRCLLVENRGGTTTNGMGATLAFTNITPATASGSTLPTTNVIDTGSTAGTVQISYNFYTQPDQMLVQYQGANIFDSGIVNGSGVFTIAYGPGTNTQLTIVMNPNGNSPGNLWDYTVNSAQAKYTYLVLTEDTNKTTTPIKFAPVPFQGVLTNMLVTNAVPVTNVVPAAAEWHGSFEGNTVNIEPTAGQYFPDGWLVDSGSVDVVINATWFGNKADEGNWLVDLDGSDAGTISTNIPTVPGQNYVLSLAYSRNADSVGLTIPSANVLINNNPVGTLAPNFNDTWASLNWHSTSYVFTATSPSTHLTFQSLDSAKPYPGDAYGVLLDAINLSSGLNDGFEKTAAGDYAQGVNPVFSGWTVNANQVTVISNATLAYSGTNLLALADGTISRLLPTVPGQTYTLSYAYRGPSLVSMWRGENNTNDSINGNNPTAVQNITFTNGEVRQAFHYDGSTSLITVPASTSLAVSNMTLEAWVFPTDSNIHPIIDYGGAGQMSSVQLWINTIGYQSSVPGAIVALIRTQNNLGYLQVMNAGQVVTVNQWNHLALTVNAATLTGILYCNGVQVASATTIPIGSPVNPLSFAPVNIGYRDQNSSEILRGYRFLGNLDEVSIYNRDLSASEIQAIYNHGSSGKYVTNAPSIAQGLAEAQVTVGGVPSPLFFGSNTNWQTNAITFIATQSNTVLRVAGFEPGMLLDNFALTQFLVTTQYVTNSVLNGGDVYYLPEQSLDTFAGLNANGQWQLEIWDNRAGAGLTNTLVSWQLRFNFPTTVSSIGTLTNGTPQTNGLPVGSIAYYLITVPINADIATNILISPNGPLNLWFNPTTPPSGTNSPGDYLLLFGSTNGTAILYTNGTPPLVPGSTYYLGVQNTNSFAVTNYSITVDFHLVPVPIVLTNGQPQTNTVPAGGIDYYLVNVPTNADWATNLLLFAGGPLNVWFNPTNLPAATNPPDVLLFSGATNGISIFGTNSTPTNIVPGGTYYLAVQNPGTSNVTYGIEVNFHLQSPSVPAGSVVFYPITVPTNADFATNILVFATGPLSIWFTTNSPPSITNATDVRLLPDATYPSGTNGSVVLSASTTPPLVPGSTYYLGVQNTNSVAVSYVIEVDFHLQLPPVPAGSVIYYPVAVPTNADFATNILLYATRPLNIWFTTNSPPSITNANDVRLLPDATYPSGTNGSVVLSAGTTPPLVPGFTYYLGVQNTNSFAVAYAIEVDFHLLSGSVTGAITGLTITATNIGGTNGFLLQWQGPTNFQYEIQWTTNLAPVVWNTVLNPVINVVVTPTNGHFSFFDDGTLTGGPALMKFYRVLGGLNLGPITGSGTATNTVLAGAMSQAVVTVPANALWASNVLISATGPLNVWFNQTNPPTGSTNAGDRLMLSATNAGVFVLMGSSVPPLVPGTNYFLGFQNLGASNVTFVFQVVFGFAPINPVSNFTITATNIGGKFGFLLTWFAPTNDYFMVEWTDSLAPPAWNTFTNIIGYTGPVTPTNGRFSFFDDGSQTGGFGPMRFYRLILLQSTNVLTLPFQVNRTIDALTPLVVTNTATDSDTNATLSYTLTSTVSGLPAPGIDANGIITWTPTLAQAGTVNTFTTVVTDNGLPPVRATNSFTVTVNPLPVSISGITITTNGFFQLQWSAPTNYQFQVAWTTNLVPPVVWNYIPPTPPYITSVTTNFTFVDTNAPTAMKFYRLVEYP